MKILSFDDGAFTISPDLKELDEKASIGVNINPILKYKDGEDVVGAWMQISYYLEDELIVNAGLVLSIYVENWDNVRKEPNDSDMRKKVLFDIWNLALGFARGYIGTKSKGTNAKGLFLPVFNIEDFISHVKEVKE